MLSTLKPRFQNCQIALQLLGHNYSTTIDLKRRILILIGRELVIGEVYAQWVGWIHNLFPEYLLMDNLPITVVVVAGQASE